jgi:hypothetical protein
MFCDILRGYLGFLLVLQVVIFLRGHLLNALANWFHSFLFWLRFLFKTQNQNQYFDNRDEKLFLFLLITISRNDVELILEECHVKDTIKEADNTESLLLENEPKPSH